MGSTPGSKVYRNAILAGSLAFITFGWDAGVLGGVLLTPEFQNTIGVSTLFGDDMMAIVEAYAFRWKRTQRIPTSCLWSRPASF